MHRSAGGSSISPALRGYPHRHGDPRPFVIPVGVPLALGAVAAHVQHDGAPSGATTAICGPRCQVGTRLDPSVHLSGRPPGVCRRPRAPATRLPRPPPPTAQHRTPSTRPGSAGTEPGRPLPLRRPLPFRRSRGAIGDHHAAHQPGACAAQAPWVKAVAYVAATHRAHTGSAAQRCLSRGRVIVRGRVRVGRGWPARCRSAGSRSRWLTTGCGRVGRRSTGRGGRPAGR